MFLKSKQKTERGAGKETETDDEWEIGNNMESKNETETQKGDET